MKRRRKKEPVPVKFSAPMLLGLLLIVGLLLLAPLGLRAITGSPIVPDAQSYTALRHAATLTDGSAGVDPVTGTTFAPTPYDVMLALFSTLGIDWLLPALLAVFALAIAYRLLRRAIPAFDALAATGAIALSPAFLAVGTRHESSIAALALCALAILWDRKPVLSSFALAGAVITNPVLGLIAAVVIIVASIKRQDMTRGFGATGALLLAGAWFVGWHGDFQSLPFPMMPSSDVLFEFGVKDGLSAFFLILAAYGCARSSRAVPYAFALLSAVAIAIIFPGARLAASIVIAVLASRGVLRLVREKWELDPLRQLLIVLVWCAAGFLIITAVRNVSLEQPSSRLVEVLSYIGEQRRPGGVLTDPEIAPLVTYFSGRRATLSQDADPELVRAAFLTRDANAMYALLESTDTSFILITREMRTELFSRSDEGMLFILPNTERFVTITSDEDVTLWYYISRQSHPTVGAISAASSDS